MRRFVLGLSCGLMLSLGLAGELSAQEPAATPTIPAAAECTVAPISLERLQSVIATPIAESAVPEASPAAITGLPEGTPADEETTAAVIATVNHLVACINAGDALRGLELYSDAFVAKAFQGVEITQEMYDQEAANPRPRDAGQEVAIYSYSEVVIAADGRAAVLAKGDDLSSPEGPTNSLFYLVNENGTWRVDETFDHVG